MTTEVFVGRNVRRIRLERLLTQAALGERMGRQECWISRIESEKVLPSVPNLVELSLALRVPVGDLLTVEETKKGGRRR